jgi:hypothetical protein
VGIHSLSNPNESQTNELIRNGFQSIIKFIRE